MSQLRGTPCAAWRNLNRTSISTRRLTGVVTTRNLHSGDWLGPHPASPGTMPIVQIVDTGHLRLVVPVPEAYVGEMQLGQQGDVQWFLRIRLRRSTHPSHEFRTTWN